MSDLGFDGGGLLNNSVSISADAPNTSQNIQQMEKFKDRDDSPNPFRRQEAVNIV